MRATVVTRGVGIQGTPATLLLLFISNFISVCQQEGSPHCLSFVSISMPAPLCSSHSHHNMRGSPSFPPFMSISTPAGGDFPRLHRFHHIPLVHVHFDAIGRGSPPYYAISSTTAGIPLLPLVRVRIDDSRRIPPLIRVYFDTSRGRSPLIHTVSTLFVSVSTPVEGDPPLVHAISTTAGGDSPHLHLFPMPAGGDPSLPLIHVHFDIRRRGFPAPSFTPLLPHSHPFPMPAGGGSPRSCPF